MYIPKLHKIWLCQNDNGGIYMYPKMANRHGFDCRCYRYRQNRYAQGAGRKLQ